MFKDLDGHIVKCGVFKQRNLNRNLKKVQCPTCGIEFIQRHYEDKHQYECRKRKVPCANCGELFKDNNINNEFFIELIGRKVVLKLAILLRIQKLTGLKIMQYY